MMMRFGATQEEAEARIAGAAREGHEHLRDHPEHPLHGRTVTEVEARATYDAAHGRLAETLARFEAGVRKRAP
jgi:hypothetical protein